MINLKCNKAHSLLNKNFNEIFFPKKYVMQNMDEMIRHFSRSVVNPYKTFTLIAQLISFIWKKPKSFICIDKKLCRSSSVIEMIFFVKYKTKLVQELVKLPACERCDR